MTPNHLKREKIVNFGSFYTSDEYVKIVWDFIKPFIDERTVVLDPACGYGAFLKEKTSARKVGNDLDKKAIQRAKLYACDAIYFNYNALSVLDREHYSIKKSEKLIVIGNPPYNDLTSQAKKGIKRLNFHVDERLKARDVGISFLRLFYYLKADYVCVLHPLSYLIKRANFNLLKQFKDNYVLKSGLVISSEAFNLTSRTSRFPIIIALYERNEKGMDFDYIENYPFRTIEGKEFRLADFDYVSNYVNKYPKKGQVFKEGDLIFYTLRDINALRRNKTFLNKPNSNAVKVDLEKLDYYVYIDVFKDFAESIPYYLGNLDIIIDTNLFERYKKYFISYALKKRDFLKKHYEFKLYPNDKEKVKEYFKKLLKEHYNESGRS